MVFPLFAAVSLAMGAIGLGLQAAGTMATMEGNRQAAAASKRAEDLRQKQMNLESMRQRRQVIRNAVRARSMALSGATAQGASSGSGIAGGLSQIAGDAGRQIQGVNQGQEIGAGIFDANRSIASAQELASFGGGLSSLGGAVFSSAEPMGRLTQFGFGQSRSKTG